MMEEPKPIWLTVEFVQSIRNPFECDPWGSGLITLEMVTDAEPNAKHWDPDDDDQLWAPHQQAGRVKWLAENGWTDPIQLDVGVPGLGYYDQTILDGHHRLAAAIYRKDKYILSSVDGQVDVTEEHQMDDLLVDIAKELDIDVKRCGSNEQLCGAIIMAIIHLKQKD